MGNGVSGSTKGSTKKSPKKSKKLRRQTSGMHCEVMLSYSHSNRIEMTRLKEALESNGFSVWVDNKLEAGVNFLDKIGQAIVDAKVTKILYN